MSDFEKQLENARSFGRALGRLEVVKSFLERVHIDSEWESDERDYHVNRIDELLAIENAKMAKTLKETQESIDALA